MKIATLAVRIMEMYGIPQSAASQEAKRILDARRNRRSKRIVELCPEKREHLRIQKRDWMRRYREDKRRNETKGK